MSSVRIGTACLVVALVAGSVSAADQAKVNEAVAKGTEYLRKMYAGGGHGQHGVGSAALAGLAMMEGGVKTNDPALAFITQGVRASVFSDTKTYHVALMIVYLDRLGDPADVPSIQFLGARLYAGMSATGGWSYDSGAAVGGAEEARLRAAFAQGLPPRQPDPRRPGAKGDKGAEGFPMAPAPGSKGDDDTLPRVHPAVVPYFNAARSGARPQHSGDNSNTQFGMIGLWVAGRHGIPVEGAFTVIEQRFAASQNRADYGWGYNIGEKSTGSMTCAGLLALAFGQARRPAPPAPAPKSGEPTDPNDSFLNPKNREKEKEGPNLRGINKAGIEGALRALGLILQMGPGQLANFVGHGSEYYLLWSIERVAMAYGLDTIGNSDWHDVGCQFLLPAQNGDGSWSGRGGNGIDVDTAFAILFLTKSNFVRDLSRKISGAVKDPGYTELRGGGDKPPLYAPPAPPPNPSGSGGTPAPTGPGNPNPMDPPPSAPAPTTSGDAIADGLVNAMGEDFGARLKHIRDTKGAEQTRGLVRAIPRLEGARQKQAREALAERLTRMTAETLRTMMKDDDVELRRGSTLAAAMKDDRAHIPDLIERITDGSDLVVRAARAGLKSLTEKDFGPPAGADAATKAKAAADWKAWYEKEGK